MLPPCVRGGTALLPKLLRIYALDVTMYVAQKVNVRCLAILGVLDQHVVKGSLSRVLRSKYARM